MLNGKKVNLLHKGLLLAKKGDIKQALASAGAVFMILLIFGLDFCHVEFS